MLTKTSAAVFVLVAIFARQSFSSLTLGTCNLQCDGQDAGDTESLSSIRQQLQGFPGKTGAVGPQGPIGPKGDPGIPCDCLNEEFFPRTCTNLIPNYGVDANGVYKIYPFGNSTALLAYCDLTTAGGGWMLIQRRMDGSEDFYRTFSEYEKGFGKLSGEFWLGLTTIHELTKTGDYELRFDMEDFENATRYAQYRSFRVGAGTNYRITVGEYEGVAGDVSSRLNSMRFSTEDRDQDSSNKNCAEIYKGGWWYDNCHELNPNGLYLSGTTNQYATGVVWRHWRGYHYSLKKMEIKIRRKNN